MELETWRAPPGEAIPNHPRFAVLVYRGVDAAAEGAEAARALFAEHGWGGSWVAGVFPFHHFHSTSHEALAVSRAARRSSSAARRARRSRWPRATYWSCRPARGTAARGRDGFTVVGAYPAGQEDYDLLRGDDPAEVAAPRERIAALGPPPQDPVGGEGIGGWSAGRRACHQRPPETPTPPPAPPPPPPPPS